MSLFEWWGESINPGPVGGVEFGDDPRRAPADPTWVLIRLVLSCAVLVGAWILVFGHYAVEVNAHNVGIAAAVAMRAMSVLRGSSQRTGDTPVTWIGRPSARKRYRR